MTLDEAITHAMEVADEQEQKAEMFKRLKDFNNPKSSIKHGYESCSECASEHRQLAEWLRELSAYKSGEICFRCKYEETTVLNEPCYSCKHSGGRSDYFELQEVKADEPQ